MIISSGTLINGRYRCQYERAVNFLFDGLAAVVQDGKYGDLKIKGL